MKTMHYERKKAANSGGKDVYEAQKQQRCRADERPKSHVFNLQNCRRTRSEPHFTTEKQGGKTI